MGVIENVVREAAREMGSKTREFYEFVLPPVDIVIRNDEVVVTADMPGFDKDNMGVTLRGRMLHIQACKEKDEWLRMTGGNTDVGISGDSKDDDAKPQDGTPKNGSGAHNAQRDEIVCAQRPGFIDKKIKLPPVAAYGRPRDGDGPEKPERHATARYENGVLSVSLPIKRHRGVDIAIQ